MNRKELKNKKVCLLSDHHISVNPRLWKEAFFYEKLGFEVVIFTMWLSKSLLQKDRQILKDHAISYQTYLNLIPGEINPVSRFFFRLRKRIANELQRFLHIGTGWAISHSPHRMVRMALSANADLYAAHLECAFFAGRELIGAGKKVSFDFEDWYSRDYLVPERPVKLLSQLEKFALENGIFCTAASESMASAIKKYYGIQKEITVVYNGFSINENIASENRETVDQKQDLVKLLWFSRTIGPNRGIESLLKALQVCDLPVELHLLGDMAEGYNEYLKRNFPYHKGHGLKIHSFIPHNELMSFISKFQIGLALEENVNDNRHLTITNKILQYLQAGLFIIASDTAGQREVASYFPGTVSIIKLEHPKELVSAVKEFSKRKEVNQQDKFQTIFSWEAQEKKFIKLTENYL